ncbi:MAG: hypothetical protein E6G94_11910 [Alphaproteobacteria bacterium]|nr:MAG: hypothetical protein E6G94_11910 [Alphaproteobacteria bacterium]
MIRTRFDPDSLVTQARAQLARVRESMADVVLFADAMTAGDVGKVKLLAPRMIEGSLAILDSQRVLFEGRRGLFAPSEHPHQMAAFMVLMYKVLGVSERNWIEAKTGGDADAAAAAVNREIAGAAKEAAALAARGRANFARALAETKALSKGTSDPKLRAVAEQALRLLDPQARYFDIMDEYAAWARAQPPVTAASLVSAPQDPATGPTVGFEMRLVELTRSVAQGAR